ncbi:MAG: hypothetical protein EB053_04380 [Chlamydiae bacterium]|nr:hypothetical protein [Chlamydiota bacterium]
MTGLVVFFYGEDMSIHPKKKKDFVQEKQLILSKEFEDEILAMAYPWAKSCKKIKRVLEDFFKNS